MTYQEQRQAVIAIQNEMAVVNHKLENPRLNSDTRHFLNKEREALFSQWEKEIRIMRSMPEYNGKFKQSAN